MLNNGLYCIDSKNKLYNKLEGSTNIIMCFFRDLIFVFLGLPLVMYLLVDYSPVNGVYFYSYSDFYSLLIAFPYFVIACIYNVHLLFKYLSVSRSVIGVNNGNITVYQDHSFNQSGSSGMILGSLMNSNSKSLFGRAIGAAWMHKGVKTMTSHSTEDIKGTSVADILGNSYGEIEYTNCKLLSNKRKYFVFSGENGGKLKKFKVYKIYKNVDGSLMEVM